MLTAFFFLYGRYNNKFAVFALIAVVIWMFIFEKNPRIREENKEIQEDNTKE